VLCDNDCEEMVNLRCVLTLFRAVSGLRFNLVKSSIFPVGQMDNIQLLVLGCNIYAFLSTYLGLSLGAKFNKRAIWDPVIRNLEKKLCGLKFAYLSKGGRLTIVKFVLSSILTSSPSFPYLLFSGQQIRGNLEKILLGVFWV